MISYSSDKITDTSLSTDALLIWYLQCLITRFEFSLLSTLGNEKDDGELQRGHGDGRLHTLHHTEGPNWVVCVCVCVTSLAWPPLVYESGKEITN